MSYRILLVDDDSEFRYEFGDMLRENYDVLEASNGKEALELVTSPNIVDLVFLDIMLPGLPGTEVLKKLRSIDSNIIIIMLTGYSKKELIIESLRGDADDYLEKPLKVEKALTILEKHLKKRSQKNRVIDQLVYLLEKNYDKNVSLNEASEIVYLSPKYISTFFKKETGQGFSEFKIQVKMKKAKEMLINTDLLISEIAYQLGYNNPESFVRTFKKVENCNPSEFRTITQKKNDRAQNTTISN
jgi:two-component system response regulator YesN